MPNANKSETKPNTTRQKTEHTNKTEKRKEKYKSTFGKSDHGSGGRSYRIIKV